MSEKSHPPIDESILVNKLTVRDAVHIVRIEGGTLSWRQAIFRIITILIIAAFTARAIILGQATAWHLFLPMAGEYLALLLSLPVINLVLHDETLRRDTRRSIPWLIALVVVPGLWITSQAFDQNHSWPEQALIEWAVLTNWITTHEMHWPILGASAAMLFSLPGRVAAFHRHGPPFVGVSMGCAMRFIVPLLGCFLLPVVAAGKIPIVWLIWTIILLAELGALYMHWDLQCRLTKRGVEV